MTFTSDLLRQQREVMSASTYELYVTLQQPHQHHHHHHHPHHHHTILFADVLLRYNDAGSSPTVADSVPVNTPSPLTGRWRHGSDDRAVVSDPSLPLQFADILSRLLDSAAAAAESVDNSSTSRRCLLRCLVTLHILACFIINYISCCIIVIPGQFRSLVITRHYLVYIVFTLFYNYFTYINRCLS